jgi:chromosome segregation ATPase
MRTCLEPFIKWGPLGSLMVLAACSSTGCDPARAGFLESLNCAGGGYQQREAYLGQGLAQAQANELERAYEAKQAGDSAAAAQQELATRRAEMARYDQQLARLRQKLNAAAARDNADQAAVHRVTVQLAELARQQDAARANPTSVDLSAIQARQQRVVRMLDDLD